MSGENRLARHVGRFAITSDVLHTADVSLLLGLFNRFVITDLQVARGHHLYTAVSPDFPVVDAGEGVPTYLAWAEFTDDGQVSLAWRRVEGDAYPFA